MKKETKLEKVKIFLDENGIDYIVPKRHGEVGHSDLVIPSYKIHIKLSTNPSEDDVFYQKHKGRVYPIFIRDEDKKAFVLEKVQNTIIKAMTRIQNSIIRSDRKESGRKEYERNMKIHEERLKRNEDTNI